MDVIFCFPFTGQKSSVCAFLDELLSLFTPMMWGNYDVRSSPHCYAALSGCGGLNLAERGTK